MSDIVERLRDSDTTRRIGESYADVHDRRQADRDEAADEITRLTAEVEDAHRREACAADLAREWEQHCKTAEAGVARLTAEVEKLRAALEPFADMGRAMMGRKHPNEAVVQYALVPTIKVFHLVRAHEARAAITQEKRDD